MAAAAAGAFDEQSCIQKLFNYDGYQGAVMLRLEKGNKLRELYRGTYSSMESREE